jgi:hypothetical protein
MDTGGHIDGNLVQAEESVYSMCTAVFGCTRAVACTQIMYTAILPVDVFGIYLQAT